MSNLHPVPKRKSSPQSSAENPPRRSRSTKSRIGIRFAKSFHVGFPFKSGILSRFLKPPAARNVVHGASVVAFLQDLIAVAPSAGGGHYGFKKADGLPRGFVQLICSERIVQIHRIWASEPGTGAGSIMMRTLCHLADRHRVEMKLKVIPIGRKPHPMSRDQLKSWYQRFDFTGARWILTRKPAITEPSAAPSALS